MAPLIRGGGVLNTGHSVQGHRPWVVGLRRQVAYCRSQVPVIGSYATDMQFFLNDEKQIKVIKKQ